MARAVASTVIDANVEVVWRLIREFDAVGRWIPGARSCTLVDSGRPTNPNREIVLGDGSSVVERLVTLDEVGHVVRYDFVPPLPRGMRSFLGTASLLPVTDGDRTVIQWMSEFDCDEKLESKMVANISATLLQLIQAVAAEATPSVAAPATGNAERPDAR